MLSTPEYLEDILATRDYSVAEIDGVYFNNWLRFFLKNLPQEERNGGSIEAYYEAL